MQSTSAWAFSQTFDAPFDAGERVFSEHYLLYASRGMFRLELARRCWLLPPQRAALIRCGTPVRIWTDSPVTAASVLFAVDDKTQLDAECRVFYLSELARFMVLHSMRWNKEVAADNLHAARFFGALFDVCVELSQHSDNFWLPRARSRELKRALDFTQQHLDSHLTFSEIAKIACVSERTLSRRFAIEISMSWSEYLRRARIIAALDRLNSSSSNIAQIATECGFQSLGTFNANFKAFTNTTPSAFRQLQ